MERIYAYVIAHMEKTGPEIGSLGAGAFLCKDLVIDNSSIITE